MQDVVYEYNGGRGLRMSMVGQKKERRSKPRNMDPSVHGPQMSSHQQQRRSRGKEKFEWQLACLSHASARNYTQVYTVHANL